MMFDSLLYSDIRTHCLLRINTRMLTDCVSLCTMPRLTHDQRIRIVCLHDEAGHTVQQLADAFNCDRRTVQRLLAKHQNTGSFDNLPRRPRRKVSTDREDRVLVRMSAQNPRLVSRQGVVCITFSSTRICNLSASVPNLFLASLNPFKTFPEIIDRY